MNVSTFLVTQQYIGTPKLFGDYFSFSHETYSVDIYIPDEKAYEYFSKRTSVIRTYSRFLAGDVLILGPHRGAKLT